MSAVVAVVTQVVVSVRGNLVARVECSYVFLKYI